jgi:hypothetical protein
VVLDAGKRLHAAHAGHADVEQHGIEGLFPNLGHGFGAVGGAFGA